MQQAGSRFLALPEAGHGEAAPGDHLQSTYRLWLVGHQLEQGRAPWRDPYTFQPEAPAQLNLQGWPFGLPFWPLSAAFGPVAGWNLLVLLTYLAAGGLACAWLRELGLPRGAALAGGLAFAIAPYRVAQSMGHLLGPISLLLPAALLAFERGRRGSLAWLAAAGAALVSIPLSGQLHLALGAIPFFALYTLVRSRDRRVLAATGLAAVAAVATGLLVQRAVIEPSIVADGRSLKAVAYYSARPIDFLLREPRERLEKFVFLGWATPVAAAAGLALLAARRYGLALVLGAGALVPALLSLGTNLPFYEALRAAFPPLRYPRVPERLMPIACLALAALLAFAAARLRWRVAPALVVALLALDLNVNLYGAVRPDEGNRAYAALRSAPPGRLLELPVFPPDRHYGSVYHYYAMQAPRERPGGYSTLAPPEADALARRLRRLNCGARKGALELLDFLGIRHVALHRGLYVENPLVPERCYAAAREALIENGLQVLARDGAVTVFTSPSRDSRSRRRGSSR